MGSFGYRNPRSFEITNFGILYGAHERVGMRFIQLPQPLQLWYKRDFPWMSAKNNKENIDYGCSSICSDNRKTSTNMNSIQFAHFKLPCHNMSYISVLNGLLTIRTIEGLTLEQTTNLPDWRHHPLNLRYDSYENEKVFLMTNGRTRGFQPYWNARPILWQIRGGISQERKSSPKWAVSLRKLD